MKERERKTKRIFWLTYITCQEDAGMLIHVVTVHKYIGTYGYIHVCTVHSECMCLCVAYACVCVWYNSEKEFKPAPLPVRLIYIYIPEG